MVYLKCRIGSWPQYPVIVDYQRYTSKDCGVQQLVPLILRKCRTVCVHGRDGNNINNYYCCCS